MEQRASLPKNRTLEERYTYAWKGVRFRDLSTRNVAVIKEGLADGYTLDHYITMIAFLIDRKTGRVVLEHELNIDTPYTEQLAASRAELWYCATLDDMAAGNLRLEATVNGLEVVDVKVVVKERLPDISSP